jgi:hypothetical protein
MDGRFRSSPEEYEAGRIKASTQPTGNLLQPVGLGDWMSLYESEKRKLRSERRAGGGGGRAAAMKASLNWVCGLRIFPYETLASRTVYS